MCVSISKKIDLLTMISSGSTMERKLKPSRKKSHRKLKRKKKRTTSPMTQTAQIQILTLSGRNIKSTSKIDMSDTAVMRLSTVTAILILNMPSILR